MAVLMLFRSESRWMLWRVDPESQGRCVEPTTFADRAPANEVLDAIRHANPDALVALWNLDEGRAGEVSGA